MAYLNIVIYYTKTIKKKKENKITSQFSKTNRKTTAGLTVKF
jgi:hypothetical protein